MMIPFTLVHLALYIVPSSGLPMRSNKFRCTYVHEEFEVDISCMVDDSKFEPHCNNPAKGVDCKYSPMAAGCRDDRQSKSASVFNMILTEMAEREFGEPIPELYTTANPEYADKELKDVYQAQTYVDLLQDDGSVNLVPFQEVEYQGVLIEPIYEGGVTIGTFNEESFCAMDYWMGCGWQIYQTKQPDGTFRCVGYTSVAATDCDRYKGQIETFAEQVGWTLLDEFSVHEDLYDHEAVAEAFIISTYYREYIDTTLAFADENKKIRKTHMCKSDYIMIQ